MPTRRLCVLMVSLAGIALVAVGLRAQQMRCVAKRLELESEWIELRRQWWILQARTARLRTPSRIHQRLELMAAEAGSRGGKARSTPVNAVADARRQE